MKTKHFLWSICLFVLAVGGIALAVDKTWNDPNGGSALDPSKWTPSGVPGSSDKAILPTYGSSSYTVTSDGLDTILDLEVRRLAEAWVNANLTVSEGGDIWGTLKVSATYNAGKTLNLNTDGSYGGVLRLVGGTISNSGVNTSTNSQILGYGTISEDLTNNAGLIRAEGGELNIGLAANDHDAGTLSAATGATLKLSNTSAVTNRAVIDLQGGTLSGQSSSQLLINPESGKTISGRGTISNFTVQNLSGATIAPSGGTLTLANGFASNQNGGNINLASGGTLNVQSNDWTNYGYITMTGGAITGTKVSQNAFLYVNSGATNSIQNIQFTGGATHSIASGANLTISQQGTLTGATISGSGKLTVGSGAVVDGRGTIQPGVDVNGTLRANSSGNTLTVSGTTTVNSAGVAEAVSNGILSLSGSVNNRGQIKANGGTVNVSGTVAASSDNTGDFSAQNGTMNFTGSYQTNARNTFTAYTGGTINLWGGLNTGNLYNTTALRPRGGTITTASGTTLTNAAGRTIAGFGYLMDSVCSLANRGAVEASGGTLEARGTILASSENTGDFAAGIGGTLRLNAALQSGSYNTFTAYSGGTVNFVSNFSTSVFAISDGLRPRGGLINLEASGATLTNAAGKIISGYGQLLQAGRTLVNEGTVFSSGGTLTIGGAATNSNQMYAGAGSMLQLTGALTNNGSIFTSGANSVVSIADTAPSGSGSLIANTGGTIRLAPNFINSNLAADALQLAGGKITLSSAGAMTNAAGKTISGYGTLMDSDLTLNNYGQLAANGTLTINGTVNNFGAINAASAGDTLNLTGALTTYGSVSVGSGAALNGASVTITSAMMHGQGYLSLQQGTALINGALNVYNTGYIDDNSLLSELTVIGNVDNRANALAEFHLEHSKLRIQEPMMGIGDSLVSWYSRDLGAIPEGLTDNMAVGLLVLGDGVGEQKTETFRLLGESTIYCFGLHIQRDASIDLGGRTIYYLAEGIEWNGIVGTGFIDEGEYSNGRIIEIIPEPATIGILAIGAGLLFVIRKR